MIQYLTIIFESFYCDIGNNNHSSGKIRHLSTFILIVNWIIRPWILVFISLTKLLIVEHSWVSPVTFEFELFYISLYLQIFKYIIFWNKLIACLDSNFITLKHFINKLRVLNVFIQFFFSQFYFIKSYTWFL